MNFDYIEEYRRYIKAAELVLIFLGLGDLRYLCNISKWEGNALICGTILAYIIYTYASILVFINEWTTNATRSIIRSLVGFVLFVIVGILIMSRAKQVMDYDCYTYLFLGGIASIINGFVFLAESFYLARGNDKNTQANKRLST